MRGRVLLAAMLVLAPVPWGAGGAPPVDRGTGDFVVDMDTTFQNETLQPANDIHVLGATLTLIDCFIIMNPDTEIWVTGSLVMRNVVISTTASSSMYVFNCDGRVDMDNCAVSNSLYWFLDLSSHDCSITNSTFDVSGYGIRILNGTPVLAGNRFNAGVLQFAGSPIISITNSAPVLERNSFAGRLRQYAGIDITYPAAPVIANNTFLNCSIGIRYFYIHQHGPDGTVSPPPGEPARFRENIFQGCLYGLCASDGEYGDGRGGATGTPAARSQAPVFIASGNRFAGNTWGIFASGEMPCVIERCDFNGGSEAVRLDYVFGMRLASDTFSNNTVGVQANLGDLAVEGCTFDGNERNLVCYDTVSTVEGNTFLGGPEVSASLSRFTATGSYVANNTFTGGDSIALRIEGTAVVWNNTFQDCPFGVYRAVRQYGQGHGRDSSQGPPTEADMALIAQNRFENNTRGIFTEGWTNISENLFDGNRFGVETSYFSHPENDEGGGWNANGPVDRLYIGRNLFSGNDEGILFLYNDYYNGGDALYEVRENVFSKNTIGVDLICSSADISGNDFTRNGGWATRQIMSTRDISDNLFGDCGRALRQNLAKLRVFEAPAGDPMAPIYEYIPSDNATVFVKDRFGVVIQSGNTTNGRPPPFAPDGFDFNNAVNLTCELELANGSVVRTGPVSARAMKPGRGVANLTVDLDQTGDILLYLAPSPDIVLRNFTFSNATGIAGDLLSAGFTVQNDNTYDPTNVSMQDVSVAVELDGATFRTYTIPYLRPGASEERRFEWTAAPGNHTWAVTADPEGRFRETRRDNNRAEFRLDINGRPVAVLDVDRSEALTAEPFGFTGNRSSDDRLVAAYLFDYGDGTPPEWAGNATAAHSFARSGAYEARLKVRDDLGLESDWSPAVAVTVSNRPPGMTLSAGATDVPTLQEVDFAVTASDPEGATLTVSWDFGDGTSVSGPGRLSVSHAFEGDGRFTVSAVVSDPDGGSARSSVAVTVRNRPPTARFSAAPQEGSVLSAFSFLPAASDPDGQVVSYFWDLGDRSSSGADRPLHSYAAPGVYNVTLTVRDDDGAESAPFTLVVTVRNLPPVARARLSGGQAKAGETLTFDASGSFDPEGLRIDIRWDFGDGAFGSGETAGHAFSKPGNYTVRCIVTDPGGATTEIVLPVVVSGPGPSSASDLWGYAALGGGLLALAGAVFLAWVVRRLPPGGPARRRVVVRRARPSGKTDVYAERLERSRERGMRPKEKGNRSMYDAMQPVREGRGKSGQ